ncbi:MAG: hypothetical protein IJK42_06680 [Prevotella sp.]|nr:hypothetical protein [Prevotella sp.]
MKISKKRYLQGFALIVVMLGIVRCVFPSVAEPRQGMVAQNDSIVPQEVVAEREVKDSSHDAKPSQKKVEKAKEETERQQPEKPKPNAVAAIQTPSRFFGPDGKPVKHRIYSVPSFRVTFPDSQSVQEVSAHKWGVRPVQNRAEAETRKAELVYVGSNPYFHVDKLRRSIPYLVPRASTLLQDIGRNFFDSLQVKGVPLHKIIVTSVLRSKDDVAKLQRYNGNATENSCHMYGTTFDICYNRYMTVEDPDGPKRRQVHNDSLKWILSEVLRDLREDKQCWVKYEVKQGCFHITVR